MPVDYSKWDSVELSDDSDIEVHPNVDKRSFIRAKQAQIHQQREQRRHQIKTLKYERVINDGLVSRIDRLVTALKSHKPDANDDNADEIVFQALIESAGDPAEDAPPAPEEGVHANVGERPTYSRMMASLVDQVKKAVDEKKRENRLEAYIEEAGEHKKKVEGLQVELVAKLAELEREEKRHITSEDIHTGFDYSSVDKSKSKPATDKATASVELLNPGVSKRDPLNRTDTGQSSGADADIEDDQDQDADLEISELGRKFSNIDSKDYRALQQFIMANPGILTEREGDGLLVEAFNAQIDGKDKYARQCVHHALLLQYCRQLGGSGDSVSMFFKRITTPQHQAQKLFLDDVAATYNRIRSRTVELKAKQAGEKASGDVEQIQLHAVDPGTNITIRVPPPTTASSTPEQRGARAIFESLPPGLRRALESGSLDEVNVVLGKMSVSEAEEVVEKLGDGDMLSMEKGVIDATNADGQKMLEQISRTRMMPGAEDEVVEMPEGLSDDPPMD